MFKQLQLKDYIIIGLIVALLFIVLFRKNNPDPQIVLNKYRIDSLNRELVLKGDSIKLKDGQIQYYKDLIAQYQKIIDKNNIQLKEIKDLYDKKSSVIDNYDIIELDSFFSARYKKSN